ncbi:MAG: hypothetical protein Q8O46_02510 [bacterium]|nr:hypothetical protein [bacterium]
MGHQLFSCKTDSIIYALPSGVPDVLTYSPAFGDFKKVLGEDTSIESFYSLAPRNYSIVYKAKDGSSGHHIKVKGLSLASDNCSPKLSSDVYTELLEKRLRNEYDSVFLPQLRKKVDKQTKKYDEVLTHFNFGNEIHCKRFVCQNDPLYETYPFGYKFNKS